MAEVGMLGSGSWGMAGLSGLGDLVLTCTGDLSRNRTVGLRLGRGERLPDILASVNEVAEGVRNTRSVRDLARGVNVEMPITEQMYEVLYEDKSPRRAVVDLMTRGLRRDADRLFGAARCRIRLCAASPRAAKSRVMAARGTVPGSPPQGSGARFRARASRA